VHRLQIPLQPKAGQTLTFETGAVLNGSRLVTNWESTGSYWYSDGHTQRFSDEPWLAQNRCDGNPSACVYEDLFMDDVPLTHVLSLSELGPGKVYFDKSASRIYIADDPTGHELEATVSTTGISSDADEVTIRGATVEKVGWTGIDVRGDGWLVERNEIRWSHFRGLAVTGVNHQVLDNFIHHNGNTGVTAFRAHDGLYEANEIAHNNYLQFGAKPTPHQEGGVKMLAASGTVVRANHSHANYGDGWWFDSSTADVLVEHNVFENNTRLGFFYETSFDAVIRNNIFRNNGTDPDWSGGGLAISTSKNVEVYANRFEDNKYSTLFVNWVDREPGSYGTPETTGLYVHDNVFIITEGWIGSSWGKEEIGSPEANNRFEGNDYFVADPAGEWWIWPPGGFTDWEGWQSLGFDTTGSLASEASRAAP
jgi:parallel beta-helix repeat protein